MALHCGPATLATLHGRLDYQGQTIDALCALLDTAAASEMVLSDAFFSNPLVAREINTLGCHGRLEQIELAGDKHCLVQRIDGSQLSGTTSS